MNTSSVICYAQGWAAVVLEYIVACIITMQKKGVIEMSNIYLISVGKTVRYIATFSFTLYQKTGFARLYLQ
jgi:hypothetical protein